MEKKVTIKEGMDIFYKNAGKDIWVYIGLFGNKVLSILKKTKVLLHVKTMLNIAC